MATRREERPKRLAECQEMVRPDKNRSAAAAHVTLRERTKNESAKLRRYFAKPGEAEWGC